MEVEYYKECGDCPHNLKPKDWYCCLSKEKPEDISKCIQVRGDKSKRSQVERGGMLRDYLIGYASREQKKAEAYANEASRKGDTNEAIAWNHTAMAYADMIIEIEKAT